jgi:hypothetical protein
MMGSTPIRFRQTWFPRLRSGFRLRAPAALTPAKRLNFKTGERRAIPSLVGSTPTRFLQGQQWYRGVGGRLEEGQVHILPAAPFLGTGSCATD